jgi:hypothetical protein
MQSKKEKRYIKQFGRIQKKRTLALSIYKDINNAFIKTWLGKESITLSNYYIENGRIRS